jgi:hypothetical protein
MGLVMMRRAWWAAQARAGARRCGSSGDGVAQRACAERAGAGGASGEGHRGSWSV